MNNIKLILGVSVLILISCLSCNNIKTKEQQAKEQQRYSAIHPGKTWLDTNGNPIQAHGFSVFYNDGTYYWYGENKEKTVEGSNIWTYGIRCYTSSDFYNWEDKGLIIPPDTLNPYSPLNPSQGMDRPHIIFNEKTQKYVCWIKLLGEEGQFMTVLTADDFLGPYTIVNHGFRPNGFEAGDFDLYVDKETGKAYIWHERPHYELICAELNDDYTSVNGKYSVHFTGLVPPDTREAPTHFVVDGKHYLYTSGTSGYFPNQSQVATFATYHGEYLNLGNPHPADTSNTSYCSQITDVIKIPGKKNLYVVLADRWMPQLCGTDIPAKKQEMFREQFKVHLPRERNFNEVKLLDKTDQKRNEFSTTHEATYVWLPITWENDIPYIYWQHEWKLEDYE